MKQRSPFCLWTTSTDSSSGSGIPFALHSSTHPSHLWPNQSKEARRSNTFLKSTRRTIRSSSTLAICSSQGRWSQSSLTVASCPTSTRFGVSSDSLFVKLIGTIDPSLIAYGNHEFDHPDALEKLVGELSGKFISSNVFPKSEDESNESGCSHATSPLFGAKPYSIVTLGGKRILFLSLTTTRRRQMKEENIKSILFGYFVLFCFDVLFCFALLYEINAVLTRL